MCYYSLSMPRSAFRRADLGEDLRLTEYMNHTVFRARRDSMVVCVPRGVEVHVARLELKKSVETQARRYGLPGGPYGQYLFWDGIVANLGKPARGTFTGSNGAGDWILVDGVRLHLSWLREGLRMYIGPEKVRLETRLGMDDPSIVHDHRTDLDKAPMLQRIFDRLACSVTR